MATRSTIALEFADGTVQQVYCHWDGYLEHNGKILKEHYSDPFKLRDLIDLGGISSLQPEIGEKHAFSHFDADISKEDYYAQFGKMTTFYARERGEEVVVNKFKDIQDYRDNVYGLYAIMPQTTTGCQLSLNLKNLQLKRRMYNERYERLGLRH